ncbi:AraC family transcriptional regulator [Bradyrhizobium japonicum]|uniref:AraC family transcriptional regulator n=1 Tax=Bradyrhizobium japonicum TaxID=375 RepID=UPI001BA7634F|nr:helix-turn-helix domain-containing protein [Bradyrhizobium japonicum]MBR0956597.1 helix-turn-helix domain-containing protein [Bradyrhizobium japonicum]
MVGNATSDLAAPLHAFRHVQTDDLSKLEQAVRRYYAEAKFEIHSARKLNAVANRCQLRDIGLAYSRLGTRVRIEIPNFNAYAMLFAHRGNAAARVGRNEIEIVANGGLIASVSEPVRLDYGDEFEHLLLSIAPKALEEKLEALIGMAASDRIRFEPHADFRRRETEKLRQLFRLLVEHLESSSADPGPIALAELEQAVVVSFLFANTSNYSLRLHRYPQLAASWQVRRAEAYIEANWDQPLTVEALALVAGVSARTLFHSFRKSRGYSPMEFVKRIRLNHARRMLQKADFSTSVTTVAFACGFGNLGHFSGYYRRAFGEMPSATLRNGSKG